MSLLEKVLESRQRHVAFDLPLWSALYHGHPTLTDTPAAALQSRLAGIEKNIQFLNSSISWDDSLGAEFGWRSPWWWFRARQFTLCELERRGIAPFTTTDIGQQKKLNWDYARRRKPRAVRISKLQWLLELLSGTIRFGSALSYSSLRLQASQRDDETSRHTYLPGSFARMSTGSAEDDDLRVAGEIRLLISLPRSGNQNSVIRPYWLLCLSTELDNRLLGEFIGDEADEQGFLVLFDVEKFCWRVSASAEAFGFDCASVAVDYYDEHFPPDWCAGQMHVIGLKPFRFAYQRELRIFIQADGGITHDPDSHVHLCTPEIRDIAGVYDSIGTKVAGVGPKALFSCR